MFTKDYFEPTESTLDLSPKECGEFVHGFDERLQSIELTIEQSGSGLKLGQEIAELRYYLWTLFSKIIEVDSSASPNRKKFEGDRHE
jgi:hypothetical protein